MDSFAALLNNVVLLLALTVIYDAFSLANIKQQQWRDLATGLFVGVIAISVMLTPWELRPGVFFDSRWVLISLCALYFGLVPTLIAITMAVAMRFYQGGGGAYVGSWVILSSGLLGLIAKQWCLPSIKHINWKSLYLFSVVIELNVLLCMFLMPEAVRYQIIASIAPTLLVIFPLASTLIGMLLKRQQERRNDAAELAENKRLLAREKGILKSLIDSIPDLIFYKTSESEYIGCNKAFEGFIGHSEDFLIKKTDHDLFDPELADFFREKDRLMLAAGGTQSNEEWVEYPDSRKVLLDTVKTPLRTENGEVFGLVGISRDITSKHQDAERIKESELVHRSIIHTAIDGFWVLSIDGDITDTNAAYCQMSGYSSDELLTMSINELDASYNEQELSGIIDYIMAGAEQRFTTQHRRKDGSTYFVEVNATYWPNNGGKFFVFIRDITERQQSQQVLKESETRFRHLCESMPKIAVQGYDKEHEVIFWNDASETLYGYSSQQAIGNTLESLIVPESYVKTETLRMKQWFDQGSAGAAEEVVRQNAQQQHINVFSTRVLIRNLNNEVELYCIDIDLTAQKLAEERAIVLTQALEQSPISVMITDKEGFIEYVNQAFIAESDGAEGNELVAIGGRSSLLSAHEGFEDGYEGIWKTVAQGKQWQGELEIKQANSESLWQLVNVTPIFSSNGNINHYLTVKQDITQQKEQELKIVQQAHFDNLTGLPNRFLALDRLRHMLAEAKRLNHKLAVLFLDFDDFKKVNDTLGHSAGDELLVEASCRLQNAVRESDVVGRLGGDEFIILVHVEGEPSQLSIIADKLLEQFRTPFVISGREFVSTISIGIAIFPDDSQNPQELLRQADSAMYHSKELGRNTYNFYTEQMNLDIARRVLIEEQLRLALAQNELFLCYQPLVDLNTLDVIGAEALLRWNNSVLGNVTPDEFIPIAEQTGLIVDIGSFVLRTASAALARWRSQGFEHLRVSINVSPLQFREGLLLKEVQTLLTQVNLPSSAIELEITEGVLISGYGDVSSTLHGLNDLGISIAMDDFGTGYSSLSYLRKYPFDTLKIDKDFVDDICLDEADAKLVAAAVSMGHALKLKVLAEGVETAEQLEALVKLGCDLGQGYLFGKPMLIEDFERQVFEPRLGDVTSK
ncbi:EAL domain-containing protein [Psychrobium sp. 1_MG-2023]|uniref:EAL domain-containing protein n=1 Tax=Psychrobium sp. 1_MG-2023 TaxID=3062624 RepID=UPI000C32C289|nr:EAL domain-containing protein [Psychrobium sp. 1_MG-2023]MDP2560664.1 EAL domain-containing protein [Psychrobium sp. 1_MG-2023]PKF56560.1 hypothetical protein CW748_08730 [Alteromonadales bacterium alter-6D02]